VSYAVLQVADFALQAVVRTGNGLAGKPAALLDDRLKKALVVQTNAPARAAGVVAGLTATQAMARCADIVLRPRSAAAEQEADAVLLTVARSLSPRVERTAAGVCTIDLTGKPAAMHLPHSHEAVERLRLLGLDATAGIARTPLLALYAARLAGIPQNAGAQVSIRSRGPGPREAKSRGCARLEGRDKIAPLQDTCLGECNAAIVAGGACPERVERADPGNSAREAWPASTRPATIDLSPVAGGDDPGSGLPPVLAVEDERSFLAPLPLAIVDPSAELAAILESWGVRTLGALTALPKPEVGRRLGQAGIDLWERASGETDRPIEPCADGETFEAAMDLENEIETLEPLLFVLRRFIDRFALQLANSRLVAAELALALHLADETDYRRSFRLPEPTGDPDILFRALHTHLETLHTDSAIKGVRLVVAPTRPLVRQHGLFDTGLRDPHGFAETLARVEAVVGADRVGTPQLETTHRPDAFALGKPIDVVGSLPAPPILPPLGLPLRRFRPPVEAQVTTGPLARIFHGDATPSSRAPPENATRASRLQVQVATWCHSRCATSELGPASVQSRIAHGEVTRRRGPWRRSGEWWKPERWAAEEWDVELEHGGLFRLSCRAGRWWVEGMYD